MSDAPTTDSCSLPAGPLRDLQELSREHDTIIDSSSDGLFVCDAQANVIRMNPASERIHNVAAQEIVGRNMVDLMREGFIDRSAAYEALQSKSVVSLLQNKDGRKLISIATPVFDGCGEVIRVVVSERDITRIDALQRQLEEQGAIKDEFRQQMLQMQQAELEAQKIIAKSPSMIKALNQAMKVAPAASSVLILGESGVGKGLFAELIHKYSGRSAQPLIKINCGAIPESLIESELFGYEKGAFTGAQGSKPGHLELADNGILFLDEVAELPLSSQVKLLRFLEDGRITRLGDTKGRTVNVRIIAATNRDLDEMVKQGRFRLDLFYRLNVIPIVVPAVRERKDCILPLVRHYLDLFGERHGIRKRLTRAASDALLAYPYPGNVRELMNICERLVVMSETELIDLSDLPSPLIAGVGGVEGDLLDWPEGMTLGQICASIERTVLLRAASRHASQGALATALGVSQPTVARRLQKYGIRLSGV
jgi:PAS domain S-box-containing protein